MREDSREEIAADIRTWLEWQTLCGTDVWRVDDISIWDSCAHHAKKHTASGIQPHIQPSQRMVVPQKTVPDFLSQSKSVPAQKTIPPAVSIDKPVEKTYSPKEKNLFELPKWWQSAYNRDKPEKFDVSQVPLGGDGVQRAFAFRDKHCLAKSCKWGLGRADAPVVLIEGHRKHLVGAGVKMLGDMRSNVIQISKSQLYWIPMKRELGCGHCDSLALAQLNAIHPKAVLVLGFEPLDMLTIEDRKAAENGEEFFVQLNSTSIPAICTYHPMALLDEPHRKGTAQKALKRFRELLDRLDIPRSH